MLEPSGPNFAPHPKVKQSLAETADKIGCTPIEINGEADHVHVLLSFPTSLSVAAIVNSLKTVSSRMIRAKHPQILEEGKTGLFWSRSYFAATAGGVTLDILKSYVESQGSKRRKVERLSRYSSPPRKDEGSSRPLAEPHQK